MDFKTFLDGILVLSALLLMWHATPVVRAYLYERELKRRTHVTERIHPDWWLRHS